ncbi:MAG: phage tail sheath protein [Desulfovibrio sp.]|jgi:phage tail sheath protein FI|nr:phage tail sheath protein [Desulfovibrio sp.]
MSQYKHGVFVEEQQTGLVTPAVAEAAMPVITGTAPVHNLPEGAAVPVNEPALIYSMPEFVARFGAPGPGESKADYTLYQAAEVYLTRYKVAPLVCVNVFDPATHVVTADDVEADETLTLGAPDVGKVAHADIIGGVDAETLRRTGLALVEEVFPRFRLNPGQILAPGFSKNVSVAKAVAAACVNICGHFRATGIVDVPDSVTRYTDAPDWLNDNNLTGENLQVMFGDCVYDGVVEPGSIHWAGLCGARDATTEGVPYWSPSNSPLNCDGLVHAGGELHLTPLEAAYLNGQGICTGLNMIGGLRGWGDQTAAYPGNTDPKDSSIPIRRMFTWVGNTLIKTCWQFVSNPIRRRLIETVQDTFNIWLNGLAAREFILGGRVTFEAADNPTTDLMDGKVKWHVYLAPPQAGRELTFILEYDPQYNNTLFA